MTASLLGPFDPCKVVPKHQYRIIILHCVQSQKSTYLILHHGRSLKLVTAHVLLTTETHFKNSKLLCGCILFISSSRYYHRYIFNMLHAMFHAYILLYTQIFHCTFQHSMHPICSRVSAFTHVSNPNFKLLKFFTHLYVCY